MFITFEGIDGSGKTTQITLLESWLRGKGMGVVSLREPGGTALSESVRGVLLSAKHDIVSRAELLLFEAARAQLVETVIRPAINRGEVVICDRFADSSTAYQGFGRGLPVEEVQQCNNIATGGLLPTITFFLDVSVEISLARASGRQTSAPDRMEKSGLEFFERVRNGYLALANAEPERFVIVPAEQPAEEIHIVICRRITTLLRETILQS